MTRQAYSIDDIKAMLVDRLDQVVAQYAPAAKGAYTDRGKYFTLNPGRADRSVGSFVIRMTGPRRGYWNDYAMSGSESHGDVIDLIRISLGCDMKTAVREARLFLGLQSDSPEDRARRQKSLERSRARQKQAEREERESIDRRRKAARALWLSGQEKLRGTPVEFYLRTRGIDLNRLGRQPGVLRYLPECKYYHEDEKTGEVFEGIYPAMVAAVTNHKGEMIATHRTWLAIGQDGNWGKAPVPKPKKVLAPYWEGCINIWKGTGPRGGKPTSLPKCPAGTHVYIAEGIEDALSIVLLKPDARVLAAISLSNLGAIKLPPNVSTVTLVADQDDSDTARDALSRAIEAHAQAGRTVRVWKNRFGGKDLNDALRAARSLDQGRQSA